MRRSFLTLGLVVVAVTACSEPGGQGGAASAESTAIGGTSEITGTVWVLDTLVLDDAVTSVTGERATLELFTDGSMLGSTGCRNLDGNYMVSGAEVVMTDMTAHGECPAELEEQDNQVVSVLGDGFRAVIEGNTLTVTTSGGQGLTYRSES